MKNTAVNNENLKEIINIENHYQDAFKSKIDAIDKIFYFYIQNSLFRGDEIYINHNEVYDIHEAKKTLELLGKYLTDIKQNG